MDWHHLIDVNLSNSSYCLQCTDACTDYYYYFNTKKRLKTWWLSSKFWIWRRVFFLWSPSRLTTICYSIKFDWMISSQSVRHTESKNMSIMSLYSDSRNESEKKYNFGANCSNYIIQGAYLSPWAVCLNLCCCYNWWEALISEQNRKTIFLFTE